MRGQPASASGAVCGGSEADWGSNGRAGVVVTPVGVGVGGNKRARLSLALPIRSEMGVMRQSGGEGRDCPPAVTVATGSHDWHSGKFSLNTQRREAVPFHKSTGCYLRFCARVQSGEAIWKGG